MTVNRRSLILGTLALGLATRLPGQTRAPATAASKHLAFPDPTETIDLWPSGAPGAPTRLPTEVVRERSPDPAYSDRTVLGISRPRMALFRPARPDGSAVLIMPGGGYSWVVIDKEGYEMARWLAERGVTAFVLFYRLPNEGWKSGPDTPLADAQRAVRLIRHQAAGLRLDPRRICAMGFSAGGHACADLIARFAVPAYRALDAADRLSTRPDAVAPIYPVVSMSAPAAHAGSRRNLIGEHASAELERAHSPHLHVTAEAPPTFLLHAEDDSSVPVGNSLILRSALRAKGVPVETHIFPDGGHGFGLRLARGRSVEGWQTLFFEWGKRQGMLR